MGLEGWISFPTVNPNLFGIAHNDEYTRAIAVANRIQNMALIIFLRTFLGVSGRKRTYVETE